MANDNGELWGEDTIYCEATCEPKDVFYQGSDDDEYDSPAARKLRIEYAGRRFLSGRTPFILTASLKGPFDSKSGWVNPWRSKRRKSEQTAQPTLPSKRRVPNALPSEIPDSLECHLPSPESLKQASVVTHPYMEDHELAAVHKWRSSVQPDSAEKDDFWAVDPSPVSSLAVRKRRAMDSAWLRKTASKRRKTKFDTDIDMNTPLLRRSISDPIAVKLTSSARPPYNKIVESTPRKLPMSTQKSSLRRQLSFVKPSVHSDNEDELMEEPLAFHTTFGSSGQHLSPSVSRISPKRDLQKFGCSDNNEEDELALDDSHGLRTVATLSSPLSNKKDTPRISRLRRSPRQNQTASMVPTKQSLSPCPGHAQSSKSVDILAITMERGNYVEMEDIESHDMAGEASLELETQQDQSSFFKMLSKTKNEEADEAPGSRQTSPLSSLATDNGETWDGLSSYSKQNVVQNTEDTTVDSVDAQSEPEIPIEPAPGAASDSVEPKGHEVPGEHCDALPVIVNSEAQGASFQNSDLSELSSLESDSEEGGSEDELSLLPDVRMRELSAEVREDALQETQDSPTPSEADASHRDIVAAVETQLSNGSASRTYSDFECDFSEGFGNVAMEGCEEPVSAAVAPTPIPDDNLQTLSYGDNTGKSVDGSVSDDEMEEEQEVGLEIALAPTNQHTGEDRSGSDILDISVFPPAETVPCTEPTDTSVCLELACTILSETLEPSYPHIVTATQDSMSERSESLSSISTDEEDANMHVEISHDNLSAGKLGIAHEGSPDSLQQDLMDCEDAAKPSTDSGASSVSKGSIGEDEDAEVQHDDLPALPQQSPWSKSQNTQALGLLISKSAPGVEAHESLVATPAKDNEDLPVHSPWATTAGVPVVMRLPEIMDLDAVPAYTASQSTNPPQSDITQPATPQNRPSTPEYQITFQSLSAFMTPSPEHRALQLARQRASNVHAEGVLASAMKNPYASSKPKGRVSWAPLPGDSQAATERGGVEETTMRVASPPPVTSTEDLPTTEDADFGSHFKAVARKVHDMPQRLLSTESQQSVASPGLGAMAENFLAADDIARPKDNAAISGGRIDEEGSDVELSEEDIFRSLVALQPWDLDRALDEARNNNGTGTVEF